MSDKNKDIIMKILLSLFAFSLIMFVLLIFLSFFIPEEISIVLAKILISSTLISSLLFVILLPIFGLKIKPKKAAKKELGFQSYDELVKYLEPKLKNEYVEENYTEYEGFSLATYMVKQRSVLKCFAIINAEELDSILTEEIENAITKCIEGYYGKKYITDTILMTMLFCVKRVTPAFSKLFTEAAPQGFKNTNFPAGYSFGSRMLYVPNQKDGMAMARYKRLKKEFLDFFNIDYKSLNKNGGK